MALNQPQSPQEPKTPWKWKGIMAATALSAATLMLYPWNKPDNSPIKHAPTNTVPSAQNTSSVSSITYSGETLSSMGTNIVLPESASPEQKNAYDAIMASTFDTLREKIPCMDKAEQKYIADFLREARLELFLRDNVGLFDKVSLFSLLWRNISLYDFQRIHETTGLSYEKMLINTPWSTAFNYASVLPEDVLTSALKKYFQAQAISPDWPNYSSLLDQWPHIEKYLTPEQKIAVHLYIQEIVNNDPESKILEWFDYKAHPEKLSRDKQTLYIANIIDRETPGWDDDIEGTFVKIQNDKKINWQWYIFVKRLANMRLDITKYPQILQYVREEVSWFTTDELKGLGLTEAAYPREHEVLIQKQHPTHMTPENLEKMPDISLRLEQELAQIEPWVYTLGVTMSRVVMEYPDEAKLTFSDIAILNKIHPNRIDVKYLTYRFGKAMKSSGVACTVP